jgi:hypothetical protein
MESFDWRRQSISEVIAEQEYAPPEKPILSRCTVCRQFFMSDQMRFEDGQWKCPFSPSCDGYGFGLNILDARSGFFARVGVFGVYRNKQCPPAGA